jgi:GT2 family glycosyltransferase
LNSKVAAVVVHHRSYDTISAAVSALLDQGIHAENLVLIDNSEQAERRDELVASVPSGIVIVFESNRGYGAAVNAGIDYFESHRQFLPEFFLVATHETQPGPSAVNELLAALRKDSDAAVAGPTLISGTNPKFIWSAGGYLAPRTHIPSHHLHRQPLAVLKGKQGPEYRDWLDGAFLLYRWNDIAHQRISERYFLYMEETDLHLKLGRMGRKSVWVPKAEVWQDSGGIPAYYLARNMRLLFQEHENLMRRIGVPLYSVGRRIISDILRRGDFSAVKPSFRGLLTKLPNENVALDTASIRIVNPLGAALRHYGTELESVLRAGGVQASTTSLMEPSASGHSSGKWVSDYITTLLTEKTKLRGSRSHLLITWPVLGYLDIILLRMLGIRQATLVMHDPHPLVKAVGYSRFAKTCASLCGRSIRILAHSDRALNLIQEEVQRVAAQVVPHPILEPSEELHAPKVDVPVVRVVGQYKPDRDVEALAAVGRALDEKAILEVYGRNWPEIEGWTVVPGFVSEERLSELMAESSAVIIPYKNFFQSGIAIRALELGVPFVGPKDSVLADMVGADSPLLADDSNESWVSAVENAVRSDPRDVLAAGLRWRYENVAAWKEWASRLDS